VQRTPFPTDGLYDPKHEHDACGTGFVANISGERTHRIVEIAVESVVNLTHRGAVNADPQTGDGAGVQIQIPFDLLQEDTVRLGHPIENPDDLALAMVFLPHQEDERPEARAVLEEAVRSCGLTIIGWRLVPTDTDVLGEWALDTLPGIEQLLIAKPETMRADHAFGRALYLAGRRAQNEWRIQEIDSYIVSISEKVVTYKGLMVAPQLSKFYPDLTDERTVSALALFHQRYATNTLPNWKIAQPLRHTAHNGEINTLDGNRNWMSAREGEISSEVWGKDVGDLRPIIWPIGSDSASLDEALELLIHSGRDAVQSMMMLIPEAWENTPDMDPGLRGFYEYSACLMEPWDGPATVAFTDGDVAAAIQDRNGLRPGRYQVTADGLVVMGSEVGLIEIPASEIVETGRLGPGQLLVVDTVGKRLLRNDDIKAEVANRRPFKAWVDGHIHHFDLDSAAKSEEPGSSENLPALDEHRLAARQILHGITREELNHVLIPMGRNGKEPVGSMGDDTPLSALMDAPRPLYTYFKQRFAQVTNPPIDSIRERIVMSLDTHIGRRHSILEEVPEAARVVHLRSPYLSDEELTHLRRLNLEGYSATTLPARFAAADGPDGLRRGLDQLVEAAEGAVDAGHSVIVLSDRETTGEFAPIPMLLAVSTVHHHLIRSGKRMRASLIAEAGDVRDVHHFACLIGFGASAVNPYLAIESLRALHAADEFEETPLNDVLWRYRVAVEAGILKIMSKRGISSVASYHGGQIFDALGIGDAMMAHSFPGTTSRIGGINYDDVGRDVLSRHAQSQEGPMTPGGWYKFRRDADYHAFAPPVWRALQKAAQSGEDEDYSAYTELVHNRPPTSLRDLLDFNSDRDAIEIDDVEDLDAIAARFQTGAMSLGALSMETHEDLARAMNQLGGRSNTGEGGEDPRRYGPQGDRRDANSQVKQIASGRFGVTPAYLAAASEIEIKIAQGSKPGEGGQLPGHKVSSYIAMLRHSTPGVELISPPPHHDIYSIEDLAQLIYDLKMANPTAKICVKLVAEEGVGTIAAGVAKAYADVIQISSADGGTGASPLSSVKYAGEPWELGLKETHEVLVRNSLRGRVILRTDGGFHTGRDVVVAAMLGAEQYGFGTSALVALGCKMARQCHLNTCPVGIATQREDLRAKYFGKPKMLVNFLLHVAQEVRLILADLGYRSIDEIVGRTDLLEQIPATSSVRAEGINLSRLLKMIDPEGKEPHRVNQDRNDRLEDERLDDQILEDVRESIDTETPITRAYKIRNIHRAVGARVSGYIAGKYGDDGLQPGTVDLIFHGSAGQSFGAFLARGARMHLVGEANDYVGKGMGGGAIAVRAPEDAAFSSQDSVLVGNTVLYGATGGSLFVAGQAGERFAVRNSGARAVIEGVGDHGCEYMTGGRVVILGATGRNFAAGMSGGIAYVLDEDGSFPRRCNPDMVDLDPIERKRDRETIRDLIEAHVEYTDSALGKQILEDWAEYLPKFVKVMPRDYKRVLQERAEAAQVIAVDQA
jgi:glutamate synthase (NADPH/NADH) large chain/glutamate synthase (ferredoxin)